MLDYAAHARHTWDVRDIRQAFEESRTGSGQNPDHGLAALLQFDGGPDADEFWQRVETNLRRLDRQIVRRVAAYMDRVAVLEDPHDRGELLTGNLGGRWRYGVGDYRVICEIQDEDLVVLVLRMGHRCQVHRS